MDCQERPVLVSGPERQVANGFNYYCKCSDLEAGQSEEKLKNEGKKKRKKIRVWRKSPFETVAAVF